MTGNRSHAKPPRRAAALGLMVGLALTLGPALAPATIEEQRQRLPPPAECGEDPIAGVWQAHVYYAHVEQWYMTRIEIERDAADPSGEQLIGSMYSEFWNGGPNDSQPPVCGGPGQRAAVNERATGRAHGLELSVDAIDWKDAEVCGPTAFGYLLDHFSGSVDIERMEFQSLLNADAPEWHDVPTVFRRVACSQHMPQPEPKVVVAPPPYQPVERDGCGLR
jgi:hypothetical protein